MQKITEAFLQLLSFSDPFTTNMSAIVADAQSSMKEFHGLLAEYREHEAREMVTIELQKHLADLQRLEDTLSR